MSIIFTKVALPRSFILLCSDGLIHCWEWNSPSWEWTRGARKLHSAVFSLFAMRACLTDLEITQVSKRGNAFQEEYSKHSNALVFLSGLNVKKKRSFKLLKVMKVETEKLNVGGRKHCNSYSTHGRSGYSRGDGILGQLHIRERTWWRKGPEDMAVECQHL